MIMVKKLKLLALALLTGTLIFTSCKKENPVEPVSNKTITGEVTIDASAYDKWVYFSFKGNKVVEVSDFKNSLKWDIGFHRQNVRVNCGKSGIGQGGTYNAGEVDFSSVKEASETGYALNDGIEILEEFAIPVSQRSIQELQKSITLLHSIKTRQIKH